MKGRQYSKLIFQNTYIEKICRSKEIKSQRPETKRKIEPLVETKLMMPNPLLIELYKKNSLPDVKVRQIKKNNNSAAINLLKSSYRKWTSSKMKKIDRLSHQ